MIRLSKEQILFLHRDLIRQTGGIDGIRDERLLDSALNAPFQTFESKDLFPTIEEKAARLGYGLIKNHAMVDGNKRIGAHAMLVFLELNKIEVNYTQQELCEEILRVAENEETYEGLLNWLRQHES